MADSFQQEAPVSKKNVLYKIKYVVQSFFYTINSLVVAYHIGKRAVIYCVNF